MKKKIILFLSAFVILVLFITFHKSSKITINKSGTYTFGEEYKTIIIKAPDVTIENTNAMNIVVDAKIGDGNVYFNYVQISEKLEIYGGGQNSVHISNSDVNEMVVGREEKSNHVVIESGTHVTKLKAIHKSMIEIYDIVGELDIQGEVIANVKETGIVSTLFVGINSVNSNITIEGKVEDIEIKAEALETIMTVAKNGTATNIILEENSTTKMIEIEGSVSFVSLGDNTAIENIKISGSVETLDMKQTTVSNGIVLTGKVEVLVAQNPIVITGTGMIETVKSDFIEVSQAIQVTINYIKPIENIPVVLDAPVVALQDNTISWKHVDGAVSYEIYVDGNKVATTVSQTYDVSGYRTPGISHGVNVRAVGNQINNLNSLLSSVVNIYNAIQQLSKPVISIMGNTVSWAKVDNAIRYEVYLDGVKVAETINTSYDLTLYIAPRTIKKITVKTIGNQINYSHSLMSEPVNLVTQIPQLETPVITLSDNTLSWTAIDNAIEYALIIRSIDSVIVRTIVLTNTQLNLDLTSLGLIDGTYTISVKAIGNNKHLDSVESTSEIYVLNRIDHRLELAWLSNNEYISLKVFFILKDSITFDASAVTNTTELSNAYLGFLNPVDENMRNTSAAIIKNDVIVTYYYYNDNNEKQVLNTKSGIPLVKNKQWTDWCYLNDTLITEGLLYPGVTSYGITFPNNQELLTLTNISKSSYNGPTDVRSKELDLIMGKKLYIQIDVINIIDGITHIYQDTVSIDIPIK